MRKLLFALFLLAPLFLTRCVSDAPDLASEPEPLEPIRPTRLIILSFDGLGADFPERFGLASFQSLRERGASFSQAYVGHMAATPVVSAEVLSSGLSPRELPVADEVFRDFRGLLGPKRTFYPASELTLSQWETLLDSTPNLSLAERVRKANGGHTFAVAEDLAPAVALAGAHADVVVAMGTHPAPAAETCAPVGKNLPEFLVAARGNRLYSPCDPTKKDDADLARFLPPRDANHLSGDAWVSEVVQKIVREKSDWRVVLAEFGAVDKVARAAGGTSTASYLQTLHQADTELHNILKTLGEMKAFRNTVVVVTSGFGLQDAGTVTTKRLSELWLPKAPSSVNHSFPALPFSVAIPEIRAAVTDSSLRFWLRNEDPVELSRFAIQARDIPGAAEIYTKQDTGNDIHYIREYRNPRLQGDALPWAASHAQEVVESMASRGGPSLVVTLMDGDNYGFAADRGGAQRAVQRIPLWILAPQIRSKGSSDSSVRLVDINPMVSRLMDLPAPATLDGDPSPIMVFLKSR